MKKIAQLIFLTSLILNSGSCKDPKPEDVPVNETELITTVILNLHDSLGQTLHFVFQDLDGDGGQPPVRLDTIHIKTFKTYKPCHLILLDESKTPVDTVSLEINEEGNDHLVLYEPDLSILKIQRIDYDKNSLILGLVSEWIAHASGFCHVRIRLKHQPGIKTGDPNIGSTDMDLSFPCLID